MAASPTKGLEAPRARPAPASLAEYRAGRADGPSKCTWFPGTTEPNPHASRRHVRPKILNSILDQVGGTPLVRINRLAQEAGLTDAGVELVAKCEW